MYLRQKKHGSCVAIALYLSLGMNEHSDNTYIRLLRAGDATVLTKIYQEQAPAVRQWVCKNNGSLADAQDIFQEAILALYQKASDPNFVLTCPVGAFLFQICRHKWLKNLKKKKREERVRLALTEEYTIENGIKSLLEEVEAAEICHRKLDSTFKQLSVICQQLLELLSQGMPPHEIAKKMGMTDANTVYRRKHACMSRWQSLFQSLN